MAAEVPDAESIDVVGGIVSAITEAEIVKLASDTSKKIVPLPLIIILLLFPTILGITTSSEPSLAVPESKVIEKVCPPSVDKNTSTFAQFTPLAFVPATFHVIVCELPAA